MSEIKQVKYLDHLVSDIETRNESFLLHVTRGQRDDSFISHFKEDGLYFQYSAFSIRKSGLILKCIYCVRKKCPAKLEVIAMKKDLIVRGEKNIRKFYLSKNLNLNEFSQKDWMLKNGSLIGEHVFFLHKSSLFGIKTSNRRYSRNTIDASANKNSQTTMVPF